MFQQILSSSFVPIASAFNIFVCVFFIIFGPPIRITPEGEHFMVTLFQIMNSTKLKQAKLIAGSAGTGKRVDNVSIIEDDFFKWIHTNDLVITSLYLYRDSEEQQCQMLNHLLQTPCVGLLIKLNLAVNSLSSRFIEIAEAHDFPLYIILEKLTYSEVIADIYNTIWSGRSPKRIQEEFFKDVFFNAYDDTEAMRDRGRALGCFENGNLYAILSISARKHVPNKEALCKNITKYAAGLSYFGSGHSQIINCIDIRIQNDSVIVVECANEKKLKDSVQLILRYASEHAAEQQLEPLIKIGVGQFGRDLSGLSESFSTSRLAMMVGEVLRPAELFYDYSKYVFEIFIMKLIGTNADYFLDILKKIDNQDYLETLTIYFDCNCDLESAARQLYVHKNTIKYRLKCISEATNLDFKNTGDLMKLYILSITYKYYQDSDVLLLNK